MQQEFPKCHLLGHDDLHELYAKPRVNRVRAFQHFSDRQFFQLGAYCSARDSQALGAAYPTVQHDSRRCPALPGNLRRQLA